jgi:hypothetical protein
MKTLLMVVVVQFSQFGRLLVVPPGDIGPDYRTQTVARRVQAQDEKAEAAQ